MDKKENLKLVTEELCEGDVVELTIMDGSNVEFEVVRIVKIEEKIYPVLQFVEARDGFEEGDVLVFELVKHPGDQDQFIPVEDDDILDQIEKEINK